MGRVATAQGGQTTVRPTAVTATAVATVLMFWRGLDRRLATSPTPRHLPWSFVPVQQNSPDGSRSEMGSLRA